MRQQTVLRQFLLRLVFFAGSLMVTCGNTPGSALANVPKQHAIDTLDIDDAIAACELCRVDRESKPIAVVQMKYGPELLIATRFPSAWNQSVGYWQQAKESAGAVTTFLKQQQAAQRQFQATAIETFGQTCWQFAQTSKPQTPKSPSAPTVTARQPTAPDSDAYWQYYADCDRWGVNLTQPPALASQIASNPAETEPAEVEASPQSAKVRNIDRGQKKAVSNGLSRSRWIFIGLHQWTAWVSDRLQQLEFASVENALPFTGRLQPNSAQPQLW